MQKRYLPPTRRSILMKGAVNPSGPHHRFARSGSVHAFHTASRGASNTRTIVSSFLFLVCLISSVLFVILFPLDFWSVGRCDLPTELGISLNDFSKVCVTYHPLERAHMALIRVSGQSVLYLKHLVMWSFTIPTACMNA